MQSHCGLLPYKIFATKTCHPQTSNQWYVVECKTVRNVMISAAESKTCGIFHNCQNVIQIRIKLGEMGHPQPPTPVKTNNTIALGYIESNIRQKRSKSWDKKYNWLCNRDLLEYFRFYWDKGLNNFGNYFTKHHPPAVHKERGRFSTCKSNVRGCVDP